MRRDLFILGVLFQQGIDYPHIDPVGVENPTAGIAMQSNQAGGIEVTADLVGQCRSAGECRTRTDLHNPDGGSESGTTVSESGTTVSAGTDFGAAVFFMIGSSSNIVE